MSFQILQLLFQWTCFHMLSHFIPKRWDIFHAEWSLQVSNPHFTVAMVSGNMFSQIFRFYAQWLMYFLQRDHYRLYSCHCFCIHGLELVLRCEPGTYQPISQWLGHCVIEVGSAIVHIVTVFQVVLTTGFSVPHTNTSSYNSSVSSRICRSFNVYKSTHKTSFIILHCFFHLVWLFVDM